MAGLDYNLISNALKDIKNKPIVEQQMYGNYLQQQNLQQNIDQNALELKIKEDAIKKQKLFENSVLNITDNVARGDKAMELGMPDIAQKYYDNEVAHRNLNSGVNPLALTYFNTMRSVGVPLDQAVKNMNIKFPTMQMDVKQPDPNDYKNITSPMKFDVGDNVVVMIPNPKGGTPWLDSYPKDDERAKSFGKQVTIKNPATGLDETAQYWGTPKENKGNTFYWDKQEIKGKAVPVSQYSEAQKRYLQDIGIDITDPQNKTQITNIISSESGKEGIKRFEDKIQADKLALVTARGESFSKAKAKYTTQSYYDTELKKPKVLSDATFERLNEEEPDRYIKMQDLKTADPLIVRQGRVSEIKNSINNFNKTLEKMPEFTPAQASQMGIILGEMGTDKDKGIISGAIDDFLRTDIGQTLTDEQKQYIYNLNNLRESAMALQTLQTGSSRGSDYMRKLISGMLPTQKTPDKASAKLQMDLFTQEFNKLTENLPTISIQGNNKKEQLKEKTLIQQLKNKTTGKILNIYSDGSKEYAK